ncbi:MAG TPA: phosphoribosylformylglycinamidine synthase subunit PurQ [Desulfohalobiaceae bacterium]|nr:phosphoribosylformylglycinamidine synthase subunit PurQ [Desulfohalobiaceae bacterium]
MAQARALVVSGYGTNCENETAYVSEIAGSDKVCIAHFSQLIQEKILIEDFNFLIFPGGFLDGDHLGAAQAAASRFRYMKTKSGSSLIDKIGHIHKQGGLILGICNGFQLLVKLGLLPALSNNYGQQQVSLSHNNSARFEDRWVYLKTNPQSSCVFTRNIKNMYLPVRHGEGKVTVQNNHIYSDLEEQNLIPLFYTDTKGKITTKYPFNPNGSPLGIAGLTDPSGHIFGLMPHPEAYNHPTNHPSWTRGQKSTMGIALFLNAVQYLKREY